jgi:hypothetical protein
MIHLRNKSKQDEPMPLPSFHSQDEVITKALERKTISDKFHCAAFPQFLRSNGPYKVYDHAEVKGTKGQIN